MCAIFFVAIEWHTLIAVILNSSLSVSSLCLNPLVIEITIVIYVSHTLTSPVSYLSIVWETVRVNNYRLEDILFSLRGSYPFLLLSHQQNVVFDLERLSDIWDVLQLCLDSTSL